MPIQEGNNSGSVSNRGGAAVSFTLIAFSGLSFKSSPSYKIHSLFLLNEMNYLILRMSKTSFLQYSLGFLGQSVGS
jgi:hypothetical protein